MAVWQSSYLHISAFGKVGQSAFVRHPWTTPSSNLCCWRCGLMVWVKRMCFPSFFCEKSFVHPSSYCFPNLAEAASFPGASTSPRGSGLLSIETFSRLSSCCPLWILQLTKFVPTWASEFQRGVWLRLLRYYGKTHKVNVGLSEKSEKLSWWTGHFCVT